MALQDIADTLTERDALSHHHTTFAHPQPPERLVLERTNEQVALPIREAWARAFDEAGDPEWKAPMNKRLLEVVVVARLWTQRPLCVPYSVP